MPRADQQIRQWMILKLLESNGKITLQKIALELTDPCHERTLRRDLDALSLSGFPIYNERENGKSYWTLEESYRRFPLPLTATELYALQCGKELLLPLEGTFITESIQSLFQKANANLSPENKKYLSLLHQTLNIGIPPYKVYKTHRILIERIKQAIEKGKTIEMTYTPLRSSRSGKKKINPYRLWYYNGTLYLIGYSYERKEIRTYSVDRIGTIKITDESFQIPLYFSIEDYFKDTFGVYRGKAELVELIFEPPASLWVRERKWHASQKLTQFRGKKVRLNLQVAVTPELTQWVLGFGAQVEVIHPASLRQAIENESWKLLEKYQKIKLASKKSVVLQNKKSFKR